MRTEIRILLAAVLPLAATPAPAATAEFTPHAFVASNGTKIDAEKSEIRVPENRAKPGSRSIALRFVRFRSTAKEPGNPIVYLAGGPGGSGIDAAKGSRFPLFQALREFGDVIAFDQRGTGASEPDLRCKDTYQVPPGEPLDRVKSGALMAAAARECAQRLRASGVDLAGYNTRESAADLEDLRKALGARKLDLWGISYGTHLAVAALRYHPGTVDRVILAGIEGPDDTYKLPSDQQSLVEEIARLAAKDGTHPDLVASISRLLKELEARPKSISLTHPLNGQAATFVLGPFDLQSVLSGMLFGPEVFSLMPDFVSRLEKGDWTALALAAAPTRMGTGIPGMSIAMDCASGISPARRELIRDEAQRTLLGDAINAPFPEVCEGFGMPDLGDAFRSPLRSDARALLISGTLDGRTRPRQADELRRTLPNAEHLVLEGAGHSDPLFLSSPKILEAMKSFLRGEPLRERYLTASPVPFLAPRTVVTLADDVLSRYEGTYRLEDASTRRVVKAGSVLYAVRERGRPLALRPSSKTEFFYEDLAATMSFEVDAKGAVTAMLLRQPDGKTQRAVKE